LYRRALLAGAAGLASVAGVQTATRATESDEPGLDRIARTRGLRFGSELLAGELGADPAYAAMFAQQCGVMTPGWEAKWDHAEPQPGRFELGPLDALLGFARAHAMQVRMHTLVWGLAMPDWLQAELRARNARAARAALEQHVATLVGHTRGRVACWDVANEVSDPVWHRGPEGLTLSPWRQALGPDYVRLAFELTREADPQARLFLNEDGLEWRGARFDDKRATYLRLIEGWKRSGVPIDGFGLQTHLGSTFDLDEAAYRRFLRELAGFGLEIHLTELDVRDRDMPADIAARDRLGAALVRRVLDTALDEPAVTTVVTWGLTDRHSYLNDDPQFRRADGLPPRGLPYDRDLRPTPMRAAIARALAAAPVRPGTDERVSL
jgi:endo-1,4-beta-xylanase